MEQILFQTFIDVDKWNEARWAAMAFGHDQSGVKPPFVGLAFENIEAGRAIFTNLAKRLGSVDVFEELYISIIEGEILGEDPGYTVHVSSNPIHTADRLRSEGQSETFDHSITISKFHRMIPAPDSPHLARFKAEMQTHKRYSLIPVSLQGEPQFDCAIEKKEIHFRHTSDITKSDIDSVIFPANYFDIQTVH